MAQDENNGARRPLLFGRLVADYRKRARLSQLKLSFEADVSARHLSFLEVGRSRPSETVVRRIAAALKLAPQETDELLLTAGFAPAQVGPIQWTPKYDPSTRLGEAAFLTAVALEGAAHSAEAVDIAAGFLSGIGIDHFITGRVRRSAAGLRVERDSLGRPPIGWLRHLEVQNYHDRDYLVTATAMRPRGFFWSDVSRAEMRPVQQRILDEAVDFRISTGFVQPIHRPDGTVRAFSSWAERIDKDVATRTALGLVATTLLETLDRLEGDVPHAPLIPELSAGQRDLLSMIREGRHVASLPWAASHTDVELQAMVGSACGALGTHCAVHAASRATALGLLPDC